MGQKKYANANLQKNRGENYFILEGKITFQKL